MINCKVFDNCWNHYKWILKAIGLNVIILLTLLFLFEPTPKSDDYDQVMILNGAFTGKYSSYLPYCHYFFSKLNQMLYLFLPNIPWYYVLQYFFIFMSFTVILMVFERKDISNKRYHKVVVFIILLLCGYELYIRFTFTKVAGITIISGFMALLDLILEEQKKAIKYILPCLMIITGMTIRSNMYLLVAGVFASSFFIFLMETKKINRCKAKQIGKFIFLVLFLYMCSIGLSKINVHMICQDTAWKNWYEANSARVRLQDYDMANFEEYKKEYLAIGVSYNDYCMWKKHAVYMDKEFFTPELLKEIANIKPIQGEKNTLDIFITAFRSSLTYYLKDTGIYIFLIAAMMLFLIGGKKSLKYICIVFSCCFLAYLYMNYQGRLQHHVDVCVLIAGAFLLLYYSFRFEETILQSDIKRNMLIYGLVILFILIFYKEISMSSYYGDQFGYITSKKEVQKKNKETMDLLSKDKEHYYLFSTWDTNYIYDDVWGMFQNVELEYYGNLGISNRYYFPNIEKTLENYGINNIIAESVNSDVIYFAATVYNPEYINTVTTYIREHYDERAESVLVKQVGEVNIYSVVTAEN